MVIYERKMFTVIRPNNQNLVQNNALFQISKFEIEINKTDNIRSEAMKSLQILENNKNLTDSIIFDDVKKNNSFEENTNKYNVCRTNI